jgi:CheY-like chemotaxis protein/anti-sigma regulatory factor (Ser/Thr protein kinase)
VTIRVLVVDDVDDVRLLIRYALKRHGGFEVVGEAGAGREAIRMASVSQPDVVLLDLGLPDITGDRVLTTLRDVSPDSRVVVYTGQHVTDHEFFDRHAAGFVTKGGDIKHLVRLLEEVGGPDERERAEQFAHDVASVPQAREFVRGQLAAWGAARFVDDALLVVSELATNAVVHAESAFTVRLKLSGAALRIEVADEAATSSPEPRVADDSAEGGRGLFLVSAVSSAWGVESGAGHEDKVTWAELSGS